MSGLRGWSHTLKMAAASRHGTNGKRRCQGDLVFLKEERFISVHQECEDATCGLGGDAVYEQYLIRIAECTKQ